MSRGVDVALEERGVCGEEGRDVTEACVSVAKIWPPSPSKVAKMSCSGFGVRSGECDFAAAGEGGPSVAPEDVPNALMERTRDAVEESPRAEAVPTE